jgi:methyltransferase
MVRSASARGTHAYLGLLGAVAAERCLELVVSARNTRRARAAGAVEHGRGHYPWMVAVHAALLPACLVERLVLRRRASRAQALRATVGVAAAQALRWWAVCTLGERWSTRVLVWPGRPLVKKGPYRFLRHPNYLAVAVELLCLPLAGGCRRCALAFSLLDAALLAGRSPVEQRALGGAGAAPG